jgi:predicted metal-dependent phosphoesterase TrpH
LGKADLHMHSTFSDGYQTVGDILSHVERATDLDVIAITDHDCIDGALLARDIVTREQRRIQVIVGAEISTADGHLLALSIEEIIPAGLSMDETIRAIHAQGGLAAAAHPLSRWCSSESIETLGSLDFLQNLPDGLEVYNASFAGIGSNNRVRMLNAMRFRRAELGGSDAHTLKAIGSGYITFDGSTPDDVINAIRACATVAFGKQWPRREIARLTYRKVRSHLPTPRSVTRRVRSRLKRTA